MAAPRVEVDGGLLEGVSAARGRGVWGGGVGGELWGLTISLVSAPHPAQGGQILRVSTALSCLLGLPLRVQKIRAGRSTPGLR